MTLLGSTAEQRGRFYHLTASLVRQTIAVELSLRALFDDGGISRLRCFQQPAHGEAMAGQVGFHFSVAATGE